MIRHIWSVLCEKAVIDKDTNMISLVNVVEEVQAEAVAVPLPGTTMPEGRASPERLPALPIELEIGSFWVRSDEDKEERSAARLHLFPPDGDGQVLGRAFDVDLTQHKRLRTRVRMHGLPVQESGQYEVAVEFQEGPDNWIEVARLPLAVTIHVEVAAQHEGT